jgi:hypothetical protein
VSKRLCAFAFCERRVASLKLGLHTRRQISYLGSITSFVFMCIQSVGQGLNAAHKSKHASWLKEQEDDNEQTIKKGVQVATADDS